MKVVVGGRLLAAKEAAVSVLEPGFLCGYGLFETMRARNNKIVYLDAHLERIKKSSQLIGMKFPCAPAELKKDIKKAVSINGDNDAYVRLTLWDAGKRARASVIVKKYRPYSPTKYAKGFKVSLSPYRQSENCLPRVKSTSYLFYRLALREAQRRGFDETLILDSRGHISEGSRSNIFFARGKELFTPSAECGCLEGITRKVIFDLCRRHNIKIYAGSFTAGDLCAAEEAFLTNSLIGVMPLVSLEGKTIGKNRCGALTGILIKKYNCLLR